MEAPARLGSGIAITVSLAALSLYLLAHPSTLPVPAGGTSPDARLIELLLGFTGATTAEVDQRHLFAAVIGAVNVAAMYAMLRRTHIDRSAALWLTVAFAFGTVHWWAAAAGDVAGVSHVVAVTATILSLTVALHGRWPLVAGILLGIGAAARLPVALVVPLVLALYAARPREPRAADEAAPDPADERRRWVFSAGPVVAGVVMPVLLLGTSPEIYGLENIPRQIHTALLRPFDVVAEAPWLKPSWVGLSLLLTTPLYVWLLRARSSATAVAWGWASVALIALPTVLATSVGAPQFGYRPSLDAVPVLFLLLAFLFRAGVSRGARLAIVASVAVNAYGMLVVGILEPPFASS